MKISSLYFVFLLLIFSSCTPYKNPEESKNEILESEKEFAMKAASDGITSAFAEYAAEDAAISRGGKIISGKSALIEYYTKKQIEYRIPSPGGPVAMRPENIGK